MKRDMCGGKIPDENGCGHGAAEACGPFDAFYRDLLDLVRRHSDVGGEDGVQVLLRYDRQHDIIRLAGPRATPRARAADGLAEVMELAQSTAEHHPYWGLLYHSAEVADTILQRWDGDQDACRPDDGPAAGGGRDGSNASPGEGPASGRGLLSDEDADDISWSLREMRSALDGVTGRDGDNGNGSI